MTMVTFSERLYMLLLSVVNTSFFTQTANVLIMGSLRYVLLWPFAVRFHCMA